MALTSSWMSSRTSLPDGGDGTPHARSGPGWSPLPWVLAGAVVPALFLLWDVAEYDRAFAHGPGRGLVSVGAAGLLGALLVMAVHGLNRDRRALATGVTLAAVLTVSHLSQERFLPSFWPFLGVALAVLAMIIAGVWARRRRDDGPAFRDPMITPLGLAVLAALIALVTAVLLASWAEPTSSGLGIQLAELLRYLLFALAASALLVGYPAGNPGDGAPARDRIQRAAWAVAAPLGLLFATGDIGSFAVLAVGVLAMLLARGLRGPAACAAAAVAGGASVWLWLAVDAVDEERGAAGLPEVTDSVWREGIWNNVRLIDAGWDGPTPNGLLPSGERWVDREFPVVAMVEQYGVFFAVLVGLALAVLVGLLLSLVLRARPSSARVLSAGLVTMLAAGLVLPGVALLIGWPRVGLTVPLLSGGGMSLILALASVGVTLGAAGAGAGAPAEGRRSRRTDAGAAAAIAAGVAAAATAVVTLAPLGRTGGDTVPVRSADGHVVGIVDRQTGARVLHLPPAVQPVTERALPARPGGQAESITFDWRVQNAAEKALGSHRGALVILELEPLDQGGTQAALRAAATTREPAAGVTAGGDARRLIDFVLAARSTGTDGSEEDPPAAENVPQRDPALAQGAESVLLECPPPRGGADSAAEPSDQPPCPTTELSPLDAAVLAAVLVEQGQRPGESPIPCTALIPAPGCDAEPYTDLRPDAVREIREGMRERGSADGADGGLSLEVVREEKATWLIGAVESDERTWSFGMIIDSPPPPAAHADVDAPAGDLADDGVDAIADDVADGIADGIVTALSEIERG